MVSRPKVGLSKVEVDVDVVEVLEFQRVVREISVEELYIKVVEGEVEKILNSEVVFKDKPESHKIVGEVVEFKKVEEVGPGVLEAVVVVNEVEEAMRVVMKCLEIKKDHKNPIFLPCLQRKLLFNFPG